ncbi:Midkine [Fukomys damarensis]|uniref:Midkine n=1 Tax=Fukomys damarensis TaxID=885580 RepID=A0A091DAM0_FUKDA|nr:Midkine [Fukomys damarensis]
MPCLAPTLVALPCTQRFVADSAAWGLEVGRVGLSVTCLQLADCKYKFEGWGACDGATGTKARQGTLKKARYNAQCQETIRVTKPCTPKTKAKAKGGKGYEGQKQADLSTAQAGSLGPGTWKLRSWVKIHEVD